MERLESVKALVSCSMLRCWWWRRPFQRALQRPRDRPLMRAYPLGACPFPEKVNRGEAWLVMISMLLSVALHWIIKRWGVGYLRKASGLAFTPGVALLIKAEGLRRVALIGSLQIVVMNGPRSLAWNAQLRTIVRTTGINLMIMTQIRTAGGWP